MLYLAAAVAYIALGVAMPEILFSWFEGAAFLLLFVWLGPAALARVRRRPRTRSPDTPPDQVP